LIGLLSLLLLLLLFGAKGTGVVWGVKMLLSKPEFVGMILEEAEALGVVWVSLSLSLPDGN
jgi:hypothetical protein